MTPFLALAFATMTTAASPATVPFAIAETAPGAACIITEQELEAGHPVIIVLFRPERFITGRVMTTIAKPCHDDSDAVTPRSKIYSVTPPKGAELDFGIGIAITSETAEASLEGSHVAVRHVRSKSDLVRVKRCASQEGLHLTAWDGKVRLWHEYYYLPYDTEPTCTDAEASESTPPN